MAGKRKAPEARIIREPARVLFHLNGYTKVMLERTEGVGLADGGIVRDLSTELIPLHLRKIGSRFLLLHTPLTEDEENNIAAIHDVKNRTVILELNESE